MYFYVEIIKITQLALRTNQVITHCLIHIIIFNSLFKYFFERSFVCITSHLINEPSPCKICFANGSVYISKITAFIIYLLILYALFTVYSLSCIFWRASLIIFSSFFPSHQLSIHTPT